jgi:hypothetical protein
MKYGTLDGNAARIRSSMGIGIISDIVITMRTAIIRNLFFFKIPMKNKAGMAPIHAPLEYASVKHRAAAQIKPHVRSLIILLEKCLRLIIPRLKTSGNITTSHQPKPFRLLKEA